MYWRLYINSNRVKSYRRINDKEVLIYGIPAFIYDISRAKQQMISRIEKTRFQMTYGIDKTGWDNSKRRGLKFKTRRRTNNMFGKPTPSAKDKKSYSYSLDADRLPHKQELTTCDISRTILPPLSSNKPSREDIGVGFNPFFQHQHSMFRLNNSSYETPACYQDAC
jgi:hypothetical protein